MPFLWREEHLDFILPGQFEAVAALKNLLPRAIWRVTKGNRHDQVVVGRPVLHCSSATKGGAGAGAPGVLGAA